MKCRVPLGVTLLDTADMYGKCEKIEAAVPHGAASGERYAADSARRTETR
jgi:aryl-alcohol dehydrogenase-like predicted oxidoreductase